MGRIFNNTKLNIWVQLHKLPFELRNNTFGKKLAGVAGKVRHIIGLYQSTKNRYGGEFLKFRIEIDVMKPIVLGFFLQRQDRSMSNYHHFVLSVASYLMRASSVLGKLTTIFHYLVDGYGRKINHVRYQIGQKIHRIAIVLFVCQS